jgi:hypothetical protein
MLSPGKTGVISRRLIARTKREPVAIELSRQYTGGNVPMRQRLYRAKGRGVSRQPRYPAVEGLSRFGYRRLILLSASYTRWAAG